MKKNIIILSLLVSSLAYSQINIQSPANSSINQENPFLDASGYNRSNNNVGKGLYFPTTDLRTWEFKTNSINPGKFSTYFDGMIVYNTGEGAPTTDASKGGVRKNLSRGFYYFKNPNQTFPSGSVANGEWVRISDANIYNSNGTLSEERVVDLNGNTLHLDNGVTTVSHNSWVPLIINSTNTDEVGGGGIAIHPNDYSKRVELSTTKEGDFRIYMEGKGDVVKIPKSTADLISAGEYLKVKGKGEEWAYIGGDGAANDVQIGSTNAEVKDVSLWNAANGDEMNLYAKGIRARTMSVGGEVKDITPGSVMEVKADSWFPLTVNSTNAAGGGGIAIHPNDFNKRVELSTTNEGYFRIWANGQDRVYIDKNAGNVGIGTTTPTEKLQITGGNLRLSDLGGSGKRILTVDQQGVVKVSQVKWRWQIYKVGSYNTAYYRNSKFELKLKNTDQLLSINATGVCTFDQRVNITDGEWGDFGLGYPNLKPVNGQPSPSAHELIHYVTFDSAAGTSIPIAGIRFQGGSTYIDTHNPYRTIKAWYDTLHAGNGSCYKNMGFVILIYSYLD
ncbi:hypothetical protein EQP59_07575 [Ornithobacterium rhinotracheale]|uniref:Uncharacterized protein n=1 Tax=Ornithobacterium rhinotracheale TaxID=28251 RepID=A0A3R5USG4_ORNRH|nr:hypothetical protein [Ornithobacterium rhinotracheale]QAR31204.1 hypothetical protein EQP59_07575 [Ornithobacterium rhinotracheale]